MTVANVRGELGAISAPTLLVWGAHDRVVPVTEAPAWIEYLPDARLLVLPAASHVPMVESPDELVAAIVAFRQERFDQPADRERV